MLLPLLQNVIINISVIHKSTSTVIARKIFILLLDFIPSSNISIAIDLTPLLFQICAEYLIDNSANVEKIYLYILNFLQKSTVPNIHILFTVHSPVY